MKKQTFFFISLKKISLKKRGFTLMEIMVAIAIFAIMAVFVYQVLRITFVSRKRAYKVQRIYHQGQVVMSRLVRSLRSAFISRHVDQDKSRKTEFKGKEDGVLFTYLGHIQINPNRKESDQGVIEFYIASNKDGDGQAIYMREKGFIDDDPEKGGRVIKLAENVKQFKFEYYDFKNDDWKNEWKAEMNDLAPVTSNKKVKKLKQMADELTGNESLEHFVLPDAVRILIVFTDNLGHEYPFTTEVMIPMTQPFNW